MLVPIASHHRCTKAGRTTRAIDDDASMALPNRAARGARRLPEPATLCEMFTGRAGQQELLPRDVHLYRFIPFAASCSALASASNSSAMEA